MKQSPQQVKITCHNPNTGRMMQVEGSLYDPIASAIRNSLKGGAELTYTELVKAVKEDLSKTKTAFPGNVSWYTVTVKNDLQVKGTIEVYEQKGRKMHRLAK
jgi:hypothetical protein